MNDKRLHIVVNDEQSIKWLEAQNNMSASIRLLIQQVANGDTSFEDYILYCAKQAPSPFAKHHQKEKPTVEPTLEVDEPIEKEEVKSESEPELDVEIETAEEKPKETEGELEPEKIQVQPEQNEDKSEEENTGIDWDEQEAQHESRIERMMKDLPNRE